MRLRRPVVSLTIPWALCLPLSAQSPAIKPQPGQITASISDVFREHLIGTSTFPTDFGFNTRLAEQLPSEATREFASLLPYFIVVTNNGTAAISKIVVRYVTTAQDGKKLGFGTNPVNLRNGGLKPKESIAISPIPIVTEKYFAAKRNFEIPTPNLSAQVAQFQQTTGNAWRSRGVVIQLDSVLLENGGVIGPDLYGILQEGIATQAAADDLMSNLARLSEPDLDALLDASAKSNLVTFFHDDGTVDQMGLQARVLAQSVLMLKRQRKLSRGDISKVLMQMKNSAPKAFRIQ